MSWEQHLTWCLPHLVIHERLKMVGKYNHISHTWRNMGPYSYIHCKLHSSWSFIWWKTSHISYLWSLHLPPSKKKQRCLTVWLLWGISTNSQKGRWWTSQTMGSIGLTEGIQKSSQNDFKPRIWRWGRITHRVTYSREVFAMKFWWGILITNVIFCARVQNGQRKPSWMVWHGSWEEIPKS